MFTEEFTALMARTGKGGVTHFDILRQRVEERWQQIFFIFYRRGLQLLAVELGVFPAEFKYPVQRR
ncbi:hypothetical protein D3C87_1954100 [compost metagenome]